MIKSQLKMFGQWQHPKPVSVSRKCNKYHYKSRLRKNNQSKPMQLFTAQNHCQQPSSKPKPSTAKAHPSTTPPTNPSGSQPVLPSIFPVPPYPKLFRSVPRLSTSAAAAQSPSRTKPLQTVTQKEPRPRDAMAAAGKTQGT